MEKLSAVSLVDAELKHLHLGKGDLALLSSDLWVAFLAETGLKPETIGNDDERVFYNDVELRRSATS